MQAHLKNALITTAIVLGTIYVLKQVPGVGPIVQQALN